MYSLRRGQWPALMSLLVGALLATVLAAPAAHAAAGTATLFPGEYLGTAQRLVSTNGQYTVSISDGNLVVYRAGFGVRYRSGTLPMDVNARLALQTNGNLVLRTGDGRVRWQSYTTATGSKLLLGNDGNLKLTNSAGTSLWSTNTATPQDRSTSLPSGATLVSADGSSRVSMQRDGNLVVRRSDKILWVSGTLQPGSRAVVTPNLGLVVLSMNNLILWTSRTPVSASATLSISNGGNLVLTSNGELAWQSIQPVTATPTTGLPTGCKAVTGPVPVTATKVAFNGTRLHTCLVPAYEEMVRAAARDGVTLTGWGWRDTERQIQLRIQNCGGDTYYNVYEKPSSACSPPTAIPGRSMHERGLAIDFDISGRSIRSTDPQFAWLAANASKYGLYNLPSESWHWSTNGG